MLCTYWFDCMRSSATRFDIKMFIFSVFNWCRATHRRCAILPTNAIESQYKVINGMKWHGNDAWKWCDEPHFIRRFESKILRFCAAFLLLLLFYFKLKIESSRLAKAKLLHVIFSRFSFLAAVVCCWSPSSLRIVTLMNAYAVVRTHTQNAICIIKSSGNVFFFDSTFGCRESHLSVMCIYGFQLDARKAFCSPSHWSLLGCFWHTLAWAWTWALRLCVVTDNGGGGWSWLCGRYPCNSSRLRTFRSTHSRRRYRKTRPKTTTMMITRAYNIVWWLVSFWKTRLRSRRRRRQQMSILSTAICLRWRPKVPENLCIEEIYLLFLFNINSWVCLLCRIAMESVGSGDCGDGAKSFAPKTNCVNTNDDSPAPQQQQ